MTGDFKKGDAVEWNTAQGKTHGRVKKKLSDATEIKGHHVAATEKEPQFLVESDKSGKQAAHKADALRKRK